MLIDPLRMIVEKVLVPDLIQRLTQIHLVPSEREIMDSLLTKRLPFKQETVSPVKHDKWVSCNKIFND